MHYVCTCHVCVCVCMCMDYLPTLFIYGSLYVALKPVAEESFRLDTTTLFCENVT
jgi:hypothetical protein